MTRDLAREAVCAAKARAGLTWDALAGELGCAPVFLCAACLGEHSLTPAQAQHLARRLGLGPDTAQALAACPLKAQHGEALMNDPLIYRFKEITLVYGEAIKAVIHEQFGDGIMSAVDFTLDIARVEDPAGDRVQITLSGKFLPYKRW
jgi:cyanate lyase